MKRIFLWISILFPLAIGCGGNDNTFIIGQSASINGLHAPWDGLEDNTAFRCFSDADWFYFVYEVQDNTITVKEDFQTESDVEPEDRIEIFFVEKPEMDVYYAAEIDPAGRVLDYRGEYYRKIDYGWNFKTLETLAKIGDNSYIVSGRVRKTELREMGMDLEHGFRMGVFRADFTPQGNVNWYSAVPSEDKSPDFHKPDMLFPAIMK